MTIKNIKELLNKYKEEEELEKIYNSYEKGEYTFGKYETAFDLEQAFFEGKTFVLKGSNNGIYFAYYLLLYFYSLLSYFFLLVAYPLLVSLCHLDSQSHFSV